MPAPSPAPSAHLRRGFLPLAALLATGLWGWWAAYDRSAASLRLALWLCALGLYALVRVLPEARRQQLPAWLAALNTLLAAAVLLSLPLPFDSDTQGGILAVFLPFALLAPAPLRPAAILLPLAALFKTQEYGAWIGLMTAAGVWALAPWGTRRLRGLPRPLKGRLFPLLAGAFSLGFLLLVWNPALLLPLERIPIPLKDLHTRLEYAVNALYLIGDYPLGGGFASFSGLYSRYILGIAYVFIESSHNLYLDLAQEQGLLALGVFLGLGSAAVRGTLRHPEAPLSRTALASLTVLAVHGFFEAPLYTSLALPLLFLPIALAPPPPTEALSRSKKAFTALLLVVIGLPLLFLQLPATRQAQIELRAWPRTRPDQTPPETLAPLTPAYERNLRLLPGHFPSHYRLGLIALQARDFASAASHLEAAYQRKPAHPGVRKALAYALVWNGEVQAALPLLRALPEAPRDLGHYARWWPTQGREDLAALALQAQEALQDAP
ncbi:MAG TPA: tetratricopeptide repeat protein [Chloroflexi bacterium]|nr:tetratricopeptide repeat protein [Chloroflexota bacterium]